MTTESWDLRELHLLMDKEDYNTFRKWCMDNHYADSAYGFRRLLELAGLRKADPE